MGIYQSSFKFLSFFITDEKGLALDLSLCGLPQSVFLYACVQMRRRFKR